MGDFFELLLRLGAPRELVEEMERDFVEVCGLEVRDVVRLLFEAGALRKRFRVRCPRDPRKRLLVWRTPGGDVAWELVEVGRP